MKKTSKTTVRRTAAFEANILILARLEPALKTGTDGARNAKKGGHQPPLSSHQTNFAVFIRTPGPMVAAATQLRIY